jgi:hypothetical protein
MWRMMIAVAIAMTAGVAKADTYQSYNITGTYSTFGDGPGTFGGTATIDVTTDTLFSVTLTGLPDITLDPLSGPGINAEVVDNAVGEGTVTFSLTGFGPVDVSLPAGVATQCQSNPSVCEDAVDIFQGTLTATPLPATLPFFVGGLGMVGLFFFLAKRKPQREFVAA